MTNHAHHGSSHHGSSLLQARNNHANVHHQHLHAAHHDARHALHSDSDDDNNHIRSPNQNQILQNRQVVVVQTVSVLQIIDDTGAVVSVSTILSDPVAQSLVENPSARVTADSDSVLALDALPTVSVPLPSVGDGAPSSTAVSVEATDTIILSSSTTLSPLSDQETVTSTPSTISTGFPTLTSVSGGFNSTARFPSLFSNSTVVPHSLFSNSSTTASIFSTSISASNFSAKTRSLSATLTTTIDDASFTVASASNAGGIGAADNNGAAATATDSPAATTTAASPPPAPGLTPAAQNAVIGGVVGSVAGIAIIALFLMFIIKWKKRQGGAIMLLGDGESTARGKGGPSSGLLGIEGSRGGEGGGGDMTQHQRSVPFAIPAALASLTGGNGNNSNNKRLMGGGERSSITAAGQAQTGSGEKGFYRVSGKKLVSVLESGGDGYSDPDPANDRRYTINNNFSNDDNDHLHVGGVRDSVLSTNSYYRDSIAFPDGAGDLSAQQPQRLQLGSPMRPESGVMVMRSGPMRTPVQQQGYFLDAPAQEQQRPLTPPINVVDPLGRSLVARDGSSRGSESRARFVEDM